MSLPAQYLSERTRLGSICGKQTSASNLLGQKNSIFSQHAKHFMNEIERYYFFKYAVQNVFRSCTVPDLGCWILFENVIRGNSRVVYGAEKNN